MKLCFLGGDRDGESIELTPSGFTMGSDADNDLVLPGSGVAPRHCRLYELAGRWALANLADTPGLLVDARPLTDKQLLTPGSRIALGQHTLLFTDGSHVVDARMLGIDAPADQAESPVDGRSDEEPTTVAGALVSHSRVLPTAVLSVLLVITAFFAAVSWYPWLSTILSRRPAAALREAGDGDQADQILSELMQSETARSAVRAAADPSAREAPVSTVAAALPAGQRVRSSGRGTSTPGTAGPAFPVVLHTQPEGTTIYLDGEEIGTTPALLSAVSAGRHRLRLTSPGYEDLHHLIHVPDVVPTRPLELRQKPLTLRVTSEPVGAGVWHGSQFLGLTPLLIASLPSGAHSLTLTAFGSEPMKVTANVSEVRGEQAHVSLDPMVGTLEITTKPAGCRVFVGDLPKGLTQPAGDDGGTSKPLRIPGLMQKVYAVRIEHPEHGQRSGRLPVRKGQVTRQTVDLTAPLRQQPGDPDPDPAPAEDDVGP